MEWTKQKPTAEGYYFIRGKDIGLETGLSQNIVFVETHPDMPGIGDFVFYSGSSKHAILSALSNDCEWLGPITPELVMMSGNIVEVVETSYKQAIDACAKMISKEVITAMVQRLFDQKED